MFTRFHGHHVTAANRVERWTVAALLLSVAAVLANVTHESVFHAPFQVTPLVGLSFWLYLLIGIVFAARAWRHPQLDRRSRRAWGVVAVSYLLFFASATLRPAYPLGAFFPSPADVLRLLFVPIMLTGLLMLPLRAQGEREKRKVWLDTSMVIIAAAMLIWFVVTASGTPVPTGLEAGERAAALAYPVSDLVLVFGSGVVLLRGGASSARGAATLLGAAMLLLALGDVILSHGIMRGAGEQAAVWQWVSWIVAHLLLALAPVVQCRDAKQHLLQAEAPRARMASRLPYLAIGAGYLLLLMAALDLPLRVIGLVVGAFGLTGVVILRQIVALRENHELAVTDTLTGLSNRRHLYDRLRQALARSARNQQTVAAMVVDMNGFKQINDSMGHSAGDQLLVAFGKVLRQNVLGADLVGRLGGDEFAVVLHNAATMDNASAVARRIVAGMSAPVMIDDTPVTLRASIGIALSRPGELTAEELLRRADVAMYRAKTAAQQSGTTGVATFDGEQPGPAPGARSSPVTAGGVTTSGSGPAG